MKAIQINGNAYRGSTGKIVTLLSEMMDTKGIDNLILCSGFRENLTDKHIVYLSGKFSVKMHQVLGYIFGDAGFHSIFSTRKVIRILKKEKPDIVHLHHLEGYYLHVGMLLSYLKKSEIPTLWTFHDCWPLTGHCTHFFSKDCSKWKTGCFQCPLKKSYPYSLFLDRSKKLYAIKKGLAEGWDKLQIVNVSTWMESIVKESIYRDNKMFVVYNGIDTKVFVPNPTENLRKKLNIQDKFIILGVASHWGNNKGLDLFLKLAERLKDDKEKVIILIGLDPRQMQNLPDNLIGVTRTQNQTELNDYYIAADVLLNLSAEETMGLVTVEAMASGTPAIVCPTTANPELVNKKCGLVLSRRELTDIILALETVRKNGKDYYSSACRKHVEANFSKESMCENYYLRYNELEKMNHG